MSKQSNLTGPTPRPVIDAINVIAQYCRDGNWEQAIINKEGGASFTLDNIYELILGEEAYNNILEAGRKA